MMEGWIPQLVHQAKAWASQEGSAMAMPLLARPLSTTLRP